MSGADPFDLARFVAAQEDVYPFVLEQLRQGRKTSHWMWFVFPQIAGLGHSAMAQRYAISSRAEAEAYLAHPLLGARLRECAGLVLATRELTAREIFGAPDDVKLRSCMTLFAEVAGGGVFRDVLERYFDGDSDQATLARLD